MVFTFHHRDVDAWEALSKAIWHADFKITNVFPVRSEGISGFHSTSGAIKWDAVMVCRPKDDQVKPPRDNRGFLHSVQGRQSKWLREIKKVGLEFGWADSLSLGYALATQQAVMRARSLEHITSLLHKAKDRFVQVLTDRQRYLLSQTTSMTGVR